MVVETRELYVFEHLGRDGRGGTVTVIGSVPAPAPGDGLAGWRDVCGLPGSLEWLRARAAAVSPRRQRSGSGS